MIGYRCRRLRSSPDWVYKNPDKPMGSGSSMPRFFFEIVQDGEVQEDVVGVELAFKKDVQQFAVRRAAERLMAAADLAPLDWWLMTVRDESDGVVGRVSFVASDFEQTDSVN